jgi:phage gp29-like protein
MGADAAAIIPQSMDIEFHQVSGFSDKPFEGLAKYLDASVSKIIIGQTMTADDGSSKAQAAIHDKVRVDIKEDDASDLAHTLNLMLVRPWVELNFGPRPRNRYPQIIMPVMEREDLTVYSRSIGELVDRGLGIEQSEVRDRIGHREPAAGARLMVPKGAGASQRETPDKPARPRKDEPSEDDEPEPDGSTAAAAVDGDSQTARFRLDPAMCPGCGTQAVMLAAERMDDPEPDVLDRIVDEETARFERVMDPVRDALEQAFADARDFEDLDRRLVQLAAVLPVEQLARRIAVMNLKALGLGLSGADLDA